MRVEAYETFALRGRYLIQIMLAVSGALMLRTADIFMEHSVPLESVLYLALSSSAFVVFAAALAYADWATQNRFSSYRGHEKPHEEEPLHRTTSGAR